MRHAIAAILVLVLLFGCVQIPGQQAGGPTVVNVTQGAGAGNQGAAQPPPPPPAQQGQQAVTVNVSQTGAQQQQQAGGQQAQAMPASEEITYTTEDNWKIYGSLYKSTNANPTLGIVLLHQNGKDRSSFDPLVPVLHDELPNADILAIDMRGYGKSTNLGTYSRFITGDYKAMTRDVKGAVNYLSFFRHIQNNYYVVGASIGATAGIRYADEDSAINAVVMLSPGMDYQGVGISDALDKVRKRVYIAVASEDPESATDSNTAYSLSKAPVKELFVYKTMGAAHGTDMFKASESSSEGKLTERIADWLK